MWIAPYPRKNTLFTVGQERCTAGTCQLISGRAPFSRACHTLARHIAHVGAHWCYFRDADHVSNSTLVMYRTTRSVLDHLLCTDLAVGDDDQLIYTSDQVINGERDGSGRIDEQAIEHCSTGSVIDLNSGVVGRSDQG